MNDAHCQKLHKPSSDWLSDLEAVSSEMSEHTRLSKDELMSQAFKQLLPQLKRGNGGLFRCYKAREQHDSTGEHSDDPVRKYLRSVVRSAHLRLCRDERMLETMDPFKMNEALEHSSSSELDHAGQRAQHDLLVAAMKMLPSAVRRLLRDRYFNEMSCEDIAHDLNISVSAVHTRMYRARLVLKHLMQMMVEHHLCSCEDEHHDE